MARFTRLPVKALPLLGLAAPFACIIENPTSTAPGTEPTSRSTENPALGTSEPLLPSLPSEAGTSFRDQHASFRLRALVLPFPLARTEELGGSTPEPSGYPVGHGADPEQPQGPSNPHTARWRVFTDQGREMFSQGRMKEAERYLARALEEARLGFGAGDAHVASASNNLAELYRILGRFQEAEPLYRDASRLLQEAAGRAEGAAPLRTLQGSLDPLHAPGGGPGVEGVPFPQYADAPAAAAAAAAGPSPANLLAGAAFGLHNLGGLYLRQGQLGQAEESYREALKIKQQTLGEAHPEFANTLFHLAEVLRLQGQTEKAQALLRRSIQILEDSEGGDVQRIVRRTMRLVQILMRSGAWEEAEALQRRALHLVESSAQCGPHSQPAAVFAEGVAQCLLQQVQRDRRSISTAAAPQSTPPDPAGAQGNAAAREAAGCLAWLDEAQGLLQRSLEIREQALGRTHLAVGMSLVRLGEVLLTKAEVLARNGAPGVESALSDASVALHKGASIAETEWALAQRRRAYRSLNRPAQNGVQAATGSSPQEDGSPAGKVDAHTGGRQGRLGGDSLALLCLVKTLALQARQAMRFAGSNEGERQLSRDDALRLLERVKLLVMEEHAAITTNPELQSIKRHSEELMEELAGSARG